MHKNYYRQYLPSAALSGFVECYWIFRSAGNVLHQREALIPGGRVEMMFNFGDPSYWLVDSHASVDMMAGNVHIMGQRDRVYFVRPSGRNDMLGIRFKAGGIGAFTRLPVREILNSMVPAELVLGAVTRDWAARLYEIQDDPDKIRSLDEWLLHSLKQPPPEWAILQATLGAIRGNPEEPSINALCLQTGWYYKKLERAFLQSVGYTPKYYHRIIRFNKAVRLMDTHKEDSLTRVCYACGYYDQSHFIRDFQVFSGTSPGRFASGDHAIADILIRHQPV